MQDPEPLEFDYVVVGGGSAGCAVAGRLSEHGSSTVGLIEAGNWDRHPLLKIPAGYYRSAFTPAFNWGYSTEPERWLLHRSIPWPRGKVVGGCSSINGLVYMRGQHEDFESWANDEGASGWGWADMLPYFRRMEDNERGSNEFHGCGGPLAVANIREHHPLMAAYAMAAQEAGIPWNDDFNGRLQEGVGYYQLTIGRRMRCSAASSWLHPNRSRPNLHVMVKTNAQRILLDGRTATGVEVHTRAGIRQIRARQEVILCAGTVNSPQLLELSGIGNPEILLAAGITPVINSPQVGENLQDHLQVKTVFLSSQPDTINDKARSPLQLVKTGFDYLFRGRGLLTVGAAQIGIFARVLKDAARPDVQFHVMPGSLTDPRKGLDKFSAFTASVCQLRPESRGHIHIGCPDPAAPPRIVANYLSSEVDRRTVVAALQLSRQIAKQPALSDHYGGEKYPGEEARTDDELLGWAQETGTTIYHPSGTCRMGGEPDSVLDPDLRVRGADRLRVADASIMPRLISGNTNAACMAIGDRLADFCIQQSGTSR